MLCVGFGGVCVSWILTLLLLWNVGRSQVVCWLLLSLLILRLLILRYCRINLKVGMG